MTKVEKIVVEQMYNLHCQIVDKVKAYHEANTEAEKEVIKAQIGRMDDEIMDMHDALVHPDL